MCDVEIWITSASGWGYRTVAASIRYRHISLMAHAIEKGVKLSSGDRIKVSEVAIVSWHQPNTKPLTWGFGSRLRSGL